MIVRIARPTYTPVAYSCTTNPDALLTTGAYCAPSNTPPDCGFVTISVGVLDGSPVMS
jgi:hypothetical protein